MNALFYEDKNLKNEATRANENNIKKTHNQIEINTS